MPEKYLRHRPRCRGGGSWILGHAKLYMAYLCLFAANFTESRSESQGRTRGCGVERLGLFLGLLRGASRGARRLGLVGSVDHAREASAGRRSGGILLLLVGLVPEVSSDTPGNDDRNDEHCDDNAPHLFAAVLRGGISGGPGSSGAKSVAHCVLWWG